MSMSQEEIEALMNGLDIEEDSTEPTPEPETQESNVNTDEIEELLSQSEDINVSDDVNNTIEEIKEPEKIETEAIEEVQKEIEIKEEIETSEVEQKAEEIKEPEKIETEAQKEVEQVEVKEEEQIPQVEQKVEEKIETKNIDEDEIGKSWTDSKIDEGIFPLPAEKDTKVVTQLSQVANDSEEKVSQIFDVLSLSLDNNNAVRNEIKNIQTFLDEEKKLLENLNQRFPNIKLFSEHLSKITTLSENVTTINNNTFDEDGKIFEAMELMQFNDINRQRIERVMAVIRKLSSYLNNIFEDDGTSQEVAVARHIHGDSTQDLVDEADLDSLINEFSNKE